MACKKCGDCSGEKGRLRRVFNLASDLFEGDKRAAKQWLNSEITALGNKKPIDVARTSEEGAQQVRNLIGRLEHGIPS